MANSSNRTQPQPTHLHKNNRDEDKGEEDRQPHLVGQRVVEAEELRPEHGLGHAESRGGVLVGVGEVVPLESFW